MSDIRLLPAELVHKIAAGEVIERPASVVKELAENALDAGATRITITVNDGGRHLDIADNGSGMTPDNLRKAFVNHATSKLPTDDTLFAIASLGFRGEALASISAIANVACHTRTPQAIDGLSLILTPGNPPQERPSGCAVGTRMVISDLFYTTPARLKFLKKPQTELAHIQELVEALALSHPAVRFTLTLENKTVLDTPGQGDLCQTASTVYNHTDWLTVTRQDDAITVTGLVTPPTVQKATKRWLALFVNGRSVRCPVLTRAIESAYEQILPPRRYPMAVINVNLPYSQVDVNVHPSKREVRYADGQAVFGITRAAIQQALDTKGFWQQAGFGPAVDSTPFIRSPVHRAHGSGQPAFSGTSTGFSTHTAAGQSGYGPWQQARPLFEPLRPPGDLPTNDVLSSRPNTDDEAPPDFRVIGQLFLTYMLVETRQGLMVVDQHIASERVLFEQFSRQLMDTPAAEVQTLLIPLTRPLRPTQADQLARLLPDLQRLGLTLTLDATCLTVTAMPALLHQADGWLDDLLNRLDTTDGPTQLPIHDVVATLSCHAAVRAGDPLTPEAMAGLMTRWLACVLPWSCPHGRPIAHTIPAGDLNRFFERPGLPVNALQALNR